MKIIVINGSPRINGATGQILSKISETLAKADSGIIIERIELSGLNLSLCTGCAACYKTGHCHILEDGIEDLSRKIEECDGLILGSPTYASNVSAQFKILIDRGHFVFEQLLKKKAAGLKGLSFRDNAVDYLAGCVIHCFKLNAHFFKKIPVNGEASRRTVKIAAHTG